MRTHGRGGECLRPGTAEDRGRQGEELPLEPITLCSEIGCRNAGVGLGLELPALRVHGDGRPRGPRARHRDDGDPVAETDEAGVGHACVGERPGIGGVAGHLAGSQTRVSTGCSGGFCPGNTASQNSKTESPNTTYNVAATGAVTVVGSNGTTSGFASPDGSVLVFTETHDASGQPNDTDSQRGLFVMLK